MKKILNSILDFVGEHSLSTILISCILIFFFLGYFGQKTYNKRFQQAKKGQYEITIIDGCEYFICPAYYGYHMLSHKGNCTNEIHIYNTKE